MRYPRADVREKAGANRAGGRGKRARQVYRPNGRFCATTKDPLVSSACLTSAVSGVGSPWGAGGLGRPRPRGLQPCRPSCCPSPTVNVKSDVSQRCVTVFPLVVQRPCAYHGFPVARLFSLLLLSHPLPFAFSRPSTRCAETCRGPCLAGLGREEPPPLPTPRDLSSTLPGPRWSDRPCPRERPSLQSVGSP